MSGLGARQLGGVPKGSPKSKRFAIQLVEGRGQQHVPWGRDSQQEVANKDLEAGLELEVQEPTCLAARRRCTQALTGEVQGREKGRQQGGGQGGGTGRAWPPESLLGEQTEAFQGGQAAQQEKSERKEDRAGDRTTVSIRQPGQKSAHCQELNGHRETAESRPLSPGPGTELGKEGRDTCERKRCREVSLHTGKATVRAWAERSEPVGTKVGQGRVGVGSEGNAKHGLYRGRRADESQRGGGTKKKIYHWTSSQ